MKNQFQISRRSFLATCSATAAASGLPLWFVQATKAIAQDAPAVTSPNNRPGVALIGCGGMGREDGRAASRFGDVVAVCDVDRSHAEKAALDLARDGKKPAIFTDFRKVMERDDVQIIVQATPDHWHTLINLSAAKAKKDVYGEKPLTLTIDEGKRMIKTVRDQKIVLQTGTQQRSSDRFRLACELIRNGRIGKLQQVNVWVPAGLREGPFKTPQTPPSDFNWDFWLGQAPQVDYLMERCHGTFRWWFDYSGGPVTDWGAHHNDIARWAIGQDGPLEIEARALTETIPGGFTTPSQFEATLTWANGIKQIVRTTPDDSPFGAVLKEDGQRNGIKFEGTDGWIWVNRDEITASNRDLLRAPLPENAIRLESSRNHMGNFFECVRSRKDPVSNVESGHRSAVVGHLIVIALRLGKKFQWDPVQEVFTGPDAEIANAHLARPMRKPYDYSFVS
ncbi:MAG: Gfo/Idh/MocA family oxidoreductase [Akkermansiaceae bacterium]|nr:Gfo/Idh/MocA family oxidoreductase [Verrucomicrobiales bacterium]